MTGPGAGNVLSAHGLRKERTTAEMPPASRPSTTSTWRSPKAS